MTRRAEGARATLSRGRLADAVTAAPDRACVLVVDDEPAICRALAIALRRAGFDARTAESGDAALAVLRERRVDALVLDLRVPDMRGDAIFHLATALQPRLQRHTVFLTGDVTDRAERLIRACDAPYVRKPFVLTDVTDAVTALLAIVAHQEQA